MTFKSKCRRIWSELHEIKTELIRINKELVLAAYDMGKEKELFKILYNEDKS